MSDASGEVGGITCHVADGIVQPVDAPEQLAALVEAERQWDALGTLRGELADVPRAEKAADLQPPVTCRTRAGRDKTPWVFNDVRAFRSSGL